MERSQGRATSEGSLLQVAYQETREAVTFATRDLANQLLAPPDIGCLGHSTRKNHSRTTSSSRNRIVAAVHHGACIFGFEVSTH